MSLRHHLISIWIASGLLGCAVEDADLKAPDEGQATPSEALDEGGASPDAAHPEWEEARFSSATPHEVYPYAWNAAGSGGSGEDPSDAELGEAQRLISEADIIELEGDVIYALSERRGLLTIDVSDPSAPQLLDQRTWEGAPFEMHLRDGLAYVMIRDGEHSTRVSALRVSDPEALEVLSSVQLPGAVRDSRLLGDVLYVVTTGACLHCEAPSARVHLNAVSLSAPEALEIVSRRGFAPAEGWDASVYLNAERAYVAARGGARSEIAVFDLTDPGGLIQPLTTIEISGVVERRWQMNEHQRIFRVLTQPPEQGAAPRLETFSVTEGGLEPLGALQLELPRPEHLRSVRFDGDRAYAVTFEQTDPLFIIDLSDPARPAQRGALEVPGWLYHMAPHGDRLVALGFGDARGSTLALSLFDVSDMDAPQRLDQVALGYGEMPEDQDHIHKALHVDPERGIILTPLIGGGIFDDDDTREGTPYSSTQIISWMGDTLTAHEPLLHRGEVRRSRLRGDTLFAFSEQGVEVFDITPQDHPRLLGELDFGVHWSFSVVRVGERLAHLIAEGQEREMVLEISDAAPSSPQREVTRVSLSALLGWEAEAPERDRRYGFQLFAHDAHLMLTWRSIETDSLALIELDDAGAPRLVRVVEMPEHLAYGSEGLLQREFGGGYAIVSDKLILRGAPREDRGGRVWPLMVFDLEGDAEPQVIEITSVESPRALVDLDGILATSHPERITPEGALMRFYLDRFDLSGARPRALPRVNIPGALIGYDKETDQLITTDVQPERLEPAACVALEYRLQRARSWEGACHRLVPGINLVELREDAARLIHREAMVGARLDALRVEAGHVIGQVSHLEPPEGGTESEELDEVFTLRSFAIHAGALEALEANTRALGRPIGLKLEADRAFTLVYRDRSGALTLGIYQRDARGGLTLEGIYAFEGPFSPNLSFSEDALFMALGEAGVRRVPL